MGQVKNTSPIKKNLRAGETNLIDPFFSGSLILLRKKTEGASSKQ